MTSPRVLVALGLALAGAGCGASGAPRSPGTTPPSAAAAPPSHAPAPERTLAVPTRKVDVVDDVHGVKVADPYRWLEDGDAPEVAAWTAAQNAEARRVLDAIPGRDALASRIRTLLEIGSVGAPHVVHRAGKGPDLYFHMKRVGDQKQPILYVRAGLTGDDRALVDAGTLSADGTTALDWWYPSWNGALLAWGRSENGSEDSTLYVRDVTTGKDLADVIPNTRHASVAWMPDGKAFYYTRYPEAGSVPPGDEKYFAKIFFHVLGTDWKKDRLVYERPVKTDIPSVEISPDGRWLVLRVHIGWDRSEVFVRDLSKGENAPLVAVAEKTPALYEPIARNDRLYLHTNDGASRYRLVAIDWSKIGEGRKAWTPVIAEGGDTLERVAILRSAIVAGYLHDAATRLERFTLAGKSLGPVPLPALGTADVSGAWNADEAFLGYTSFVTPPEVLRVDPAKPDAPPSVWDRVGAGFAAPKVAVKLMYATSKDGTRVPMFVVAREGIPLDGSNPTLLWGYGGFNANSTPAFSVRALVTVEQGGVFALAVLRGGGEFGEAWHQAGMLDKKQNVFDDFIACAETLIADKITSPAKLGVIGGSNGGLLTAAVAVQRPDLFRVALSLVPLTDMLRFHKFRIGRLWVTEYGDPDDPQQFKAIYAYSPYHHVKEGTRYPAMLFTTAESDSRVDPMHARKMAARMQEAQAAPDRPILLRVESKAGHGAGKPVTKVADEMTDELGFAFAQLGATPTK